MKQKFNLFATLLLLSVINLNAQNFLTSALLDLVKTFPPNSGKYNEGGLPQNGYHPLTTFDKQNDINFEVKRIRLLIQNGENHYKSIYERIYNNVINCNDEPESCKPESRAKDAAFVYLIGIKPDSTILDESTSPTPRYRAILSRGVMHKTQ